MKRTRLMSSSWPKHSYYSSEKLRIHATRTANGRVTCVGAGSQKLCFVYLAGQLRGFGGVSGDGGSATAIDRS